MFVFTPPHQVHQVHQDAVWDIFSDSHCILQAKIFAMCEDISGRIVLRFCNRRVSQSTCWYVGVCKASFILLLLHDMISLFIMIFYCLRIYSNLGNIFPFVYKPILLVFLRWVDGCCQSLLLCYRDSAYSTRTNFRRAFPADPDLKTGSRATDCLAINQQLSDSNQQCTTNLVCNSSSHFLVAIC